MESKISEANSHGDIFISVCNFSTMAISFIIIKMLHNKFEGSRSKGLRASSLSSYAKIIAG